MNREGIQRVLAKKHFEVHVLSAAWEGKTTGIIAASVFRPSPRHLLAAVRKAGLMHHAIQTAGAFGITLLARDQLPLVKRFAFYEGDPTEKFQGVPHVTKVTGAPLLADCVGWLDLRVVGSLDAGDYTLFLGEIVAGDLVRDEEPLRSTDLAASQEYQAWMAEWRARPRGTE